MSGIWCEEGGGGLDGDRRPSVLTGRPLWTILAGAAVVLALAACSSAVPEGGDPWSASYAEDDGRVWAAIHQTLDTLGYVVEEEDRSDGRIRAAQVSDRPYEGVVLRIDQCGRPRWCTSTCVRRGARRFPSATTAGATRRCGSSSASSTGGSNGAPCATAVQCEWPPASPK